MLQSRDPFAVAGCRTCRSRAGLTFTTDIFATRRPGGTAGPAILMLGRGFTGGRTCISSADPKSSSEAFRSLSSIRRDAAPASRQRHRFQARLRSPVQGHNRLSVGATRGRSRTDWLRRRQHGGVLRAARRGLRAEGQGASAMVRLLRRAQRIVRMVSADPHAESNGSLE